MTSPELRRAIRAWLRTSVSGFFTNTRRAAASTCDVCTGPSTAALCVQCRGHRAAFGRDLADLVVPLTYVRARMRPIHQSEHHMYAYKRTPPAAKCADDLALMVLAATALHSGCITQVAGSQPTAVTFVPSTRAQGAAHPAAQLARQVVSHGQPLQRVGLELGPSGTDPRRAVLADRFVVPVRWRDRVIDNHVLVVDDAWISGAKAQSAAVALKAAGAHRVTILCIGRWLRHDWADHRTFIEGLDDPYDPDRCPISGYACPP